MDDFLWWRDGVIYQVYVRSFADGNGDGLGDLPGLISRLDYLSNLGIDALWLSPIYPSPDVDFGYDVADHTAVDPRYGTLGDFDRLLAEAHRRGIRVILDMVMNHTSDRHPWFQESRSSRDSARRDWYIWSDHPNNWKAAFGGSAWEHDAATGQYYLHLFARQQPDVNWRSPDVRAAQLDVFRFWLERGVDGFRLDVYNAYFKDAGLRDNPRKAGLRGFDRQHHLHDMDQPEMMPLLRDLRALLDSYPERYSVGETYFATPAKTVSYCGPDKLHAAFSFDFTRSDLRYPWNPSWIAERIAARGGRCPGTNGHGPAPDPARHALPVLRGRDRHARHLPAPERDSRPVREEILARLQGPRRLPIHPDFPRRNVASQAADSGTRSLISLRKASPALVRGEYVPLPTPRGTLAFLRSLPQQEVLVAMNFGRREAALDLDPALGAAGRVLLCSRPGSKRMEAGRCERGPLEVVIQEITA